MSDLTDVELDERLSELERDLGPALQAAYRSGAIGADSAARIRTRAFSSGAAPRPSRPWLRVVGHRAWTALAATLVGVVVVGGAVFANRPQPVSAANVLDQLQAEAYGVMQDGGGPCPRPGDARTGVGAVMIQAPAPGSGKAAGPGAGPVTAANANELSDKLASALGISGDRVRQAMVATVRADMGPMPPDPMASIARQLGKTPEEVCAAFFDPAQSGGDQQIVRETATSAGSGGQDPRTEAELRVAGKVIDLNNPTPEQLNAPAQRLSVTPEQLRAAIRASLPSTPPPPPPSEDQIIARLASNLGISEDKVRAAIMQVEGSGPFYFVVPLPGLSH
jgi:hypothetical protein